MSKAEYALLQDVIMDADFPDLDLALRRGRHIDREDAAWYALLSDAQELLEPFYRRYGCELIHKTDGYFYLLPTGDKVSRKQLAATDMLVGQALALLYLDPAALERGGVVTQEEIVSQLSAVLGSDALIGAFSPGKRKVRDERIAQRNVRQRVGESVRRLAALGFVELSDENAVRLRAALLRFAEPVRGLSEPAEALAKLVAQGEVALAPDEPEEGEDSDESRENAEQEPDRTTLVGVPAPAVVGAVQTLQPSATASAPADDAERMPHSESADVSAQPAQAVIAGDGEALESATPTRDGVASQRDCGGPVGNAQAPAEPGSSPLHGGASADRVGSGTGSADALGEVTRGAREASGSAEAPSELAREARGPRAGGEASSELAREARGPRAGAEASEELSGASQGDADRVGLELGGAGASAGLEREGRGPDADAVGSGLQLEAAELADEPTADTLSGIGAPAVEDEPVAERSAVVRKPRAPVSDDDLDWADIVVPVPDAEEGS